MAERRKRFNMSVEKFIDKEGDVTLWSAPDYPWFYKYVWNNKTKEVCLRFSGRRGSDNILDKKADTLEEAVRLVKEDLWESGI
jgi:hypothetical protein